MPTEPPSKSVPPSKEAEEERKKVDMMKKYYRNRYATFLKTLSENKKKKESELDFIKVKEDAKRAKLKEDVGIRDVQSRFMEDLQKNAQIAIDL